MRREKKKQIKKQLFDPEYIENVLEEKHVCYLKDEEVYHLKRKLRER